MKTLTEMPDISPGGWYTVKETAEILEVSKPTVRRYIDRLGIRPILRKSDSRLLLKGTDVRRMLIERY